MTIKPLFDRVVVKKEEAEKQLQRVLFFPVLRRKSLSYLRLLPFPAVKLMVSTAMTSQPGDKVIISKRRYEVKIDGVNTI